MRYGSRDGRKGSDNEIGRAAGEESQDSAYRNSCLPAAERQSPTRSPFIHTDNTRVLLRRPIIHHSERRSGVPFGRTTSSRSSAAKSLKIRLTPALPGASSIFETAFCASPTLSPTAF